MKFKVGDRIKVIGIDPCWILMNNNCHDYIGKIGRIVRAEDDKYRIDIDNCESAWLDTEIIKYVRLDKLKRVLI